LLVTVTVGVDESPVCVYEMVCDAGSPPTPPVSESVMGLLADDVGDAVSGPIVGLGVGVTLGVELPPPPPPQAASKTTASVNMTRTADFKRFSPGLNCVVRKAHWRMTWRRSFRRRSLGVKSEFHEKIFEKGAATPKLLPDV
jgi:hypothetical protein